jgi:hypothetical protein
VALGRKLELGCSLLYGGFEPSRACCPKRDPARGGKVVFACAGFVAELVLVPEIEVASGVAETDLESDDPLETLDAATIESVTGFFLKIETRLSETELHPAAKICHPNNIELFVLPLPIGNFLPYRWNRNTSRIHGVA